MSENVNNIISQTHRPDGTLATQIIKTDKGKILFQYDKDGHVAETISNTYEK